MSGRLFNNGGIRSYYSNPTSNSQSGTTVLGGGMYVQRFPPSNTDVANDRLFMGTTNATSYVLLKGGTSSPVTLTARMLHPLDIS